MKQAYIFFTAVFFMLLAACGDEKSKEPAQKAETPTPSFTASVTVTATPTATVAPTSTPTVAPTEAPADIPEVAEDEENFEKALNDFLIAELGQYFAPLEHCIPFTILVDLDDVDKENVKIYGIFWVQDYKLNGTVLENVSGGCFPGVVKGKKTDGVWEFTEIERVASGSGNAESAKKIFGDRYEAYSMVISNDNVRTMLRTEAVKKYVKANDLNVTAYKDYGCDPIELE
ncbi:MAG: hypothetical protein K6F63_02210 [Lachnospiraceae bacterium]|nr:hypothetical protein [Lachnospiraceae bacterium]